MNFIKIILSLTVLAILLTGCGEDTAHSDSSNGVNGVYDGTTSTTVSTSIPFPTLPTNIALDSKYIPPQ